MRILFVVSGSPASASPRYRAGHLAEALRRDKETAVRIVSVDSPAPLSIFPGEIVVLHRIGFSGWGEKILQAARRAGAVVVWSTDDLIFTPDFSHQIGLHYPRDPIRYRQHREAAKDFARMLRACDAALVSTDYLAQCLRFTLAQDVSAERATVSASEMPVYVVRNFLSAAQRDHAKAALQAVTPMPTVTLPEATTAAPTVTLAYLSGSATHNLDLAAIASPLAAVLSRFPHARLLIAGPMTLPAALGSFADSGQILRHAFVPWADLPGLLAHCRVAINLAPLDTSRPFCHAKSEVKFLEAAAVRVPTVASRSAGFAEGVRDGEDCVLATAPADWEKALTDLIQNPDLRQTLGCAAEAALHARGTVSANAESVQDLFQNLARLVPESADADRSPRGISTVQPSLRERFLYAAKRAEQKAMHGGFRLLRHLRRLREDVSGD